jgi:putative polyhydroxyalkanoate system protein
MPKLNFRRSHTLSIAEASARLKTLVDEFVANYGHLVKSVDWNSDGSSMKAKGTGFKGDFRVTSSSVEVDLNLGLVAIPIKGRIEQNMNERLDKAFGD